MIFKPFLTSEDISSLQIQEAQSSKKQKRTPEQIEAMFSAIQEELDNQRKRFAESGPKKKKFRL